jgi:hypothetical protein
MRRKIWCDGWKRKYFRLGGEVNKAYVMRSESWLISSSFIYLHDTECPQPSGGRRCRAYSRSAQRFWRRRQRTRERKKRTEDLKMWERNTVNVWLDFYLNHSVLCYRNYYDFFYWDCPHRLPVSFNLCTVLWLNVPYDPCNHLVIEVLHA